MCYSIRLNEMFIIKRRKNSFLGNQAKLKTQGLYNFLHLLQLMFKKLYEMVSNVCIGN